MAIKDYSYYLSYFGNADYYIKDGCMNKKNNGSYLGDSFGVYEVKNYHGISPRSFLAGSYRFYVSELEIFQVIH